MDDSQHDDRPQEDGQDDIDYMYYRSTFLENTLIATALRNAELGFEDGPHQEIVKRFVKAGIYKGLEIGLFRPDGEAHIEMPRPRGRVDTIFDWDDKVPWSVAIEVASQLDVDADEVRARFVVDHKEKLDNAGKLGPIEESIEDIPEDVRAQLRELANSIADKMARQMAEQMGGSDKYFLHCHHDDHACIHGYDSIEELIDSAATELLLGHLQSVEVVTLNDEVVVDEHKLRDWVDNRMALMRSARNN